MTLTIPQAYADSRVFPFQIQHPPQPNHPRLNRDYNSNSCKFEVVLLGNIEFAEFYINQPLQINIERDSDGSYVVSDDIFLVFGNGRSISDALHDYIYSLREFYFMIKKNSKIDQFDKKLFKYLHSFLRLKNQWGHDAIQADRD